MAKPVQIQISCILGRVKKILDFGREHQMQNNQGELKNATVCKKIIDFVIDLRHHEVYDRILKTEGLTLFQLVERALFDYSARHGYIKKNRRI